MFYFGILSSYLPYLLFFLASVCYLGFNYVQNLKQDTGADKVEYLDTEDQLKTSSESTIHFDEVDTENELTICDSYIGLTTLVTGKKLRTIYKNQSYILDEKHPHWSRPPPTHS